MSDSLQMYDPQQAIMEAANNLSIEAAKISFLRDDATKDETDPSKIVKILLNKFSKANIAAMAFVRPAMVPDDQ